MNARTYKEGRMAAAARSLLSRTLDRRRGSSKKSAGATACGGGGGTVVVAAGCFSVYVGAGRERFVVPVERANHPLFRRLLDDAELEYGYAAQGPLALPGCDVAAFHDVLWRIQHDDEEEEGIPAAALSSPACGLMMPWSSGRVALGYRTLSPARSSLRWWP